MLLFRNVLSVALCTAAVSAVACGQATPTAVAADPYESFALPNIGGSLRYALTASETVLTGYNGTTGQGASNYTNFSGDLAYLSSSQKHPFSAVYTGGYLVGTSSFPSYFYQSLSLSQQLHTRNWNFIVGDAVSYVPQTPVGDLSGIPGAGDIGVPAVQINTGPALDILTTYATRVSNAVSGTATRRLTAGTSFSLNGGDSIQRYTNTSSGFQGINNDQESAGASVSHRLGERSTVGGGYQFTNSSFPSALIGTGTGNYGFQTHSAQAQFTRQLTRRTSFSLGAGPQWAVSGSQGGVLTGTSVSVAVNAGLTYDARRFLSSLTYSRGINNGNGVVIGSELDSLAANISRTFARIYNVGGLVAYNHSQQLSNAVLPNYNSSGVIAGGQLSARIRQPLSVFTSYTIQRQLFNGFSPTGIAFNGLTQYVSFGITYSPKPLFTRK